jgi:chromosome segregation ATPase
MSMTLSETMRRCYEARELPTWGDILNAADDLERLTRQLAEARRELAEWKEGNRLHVAAENVANERRKEAERKLAEAQAALRQIELNDQTAAELSPEMRRLVIAARIVGFGDVSREAIDELGEASEAFAEIVPWDDEPPTDSNQPDMSTT